MKPYTSLYLLCRKEWTQKPSEGPVKTFLLSRFPTKSVQTSLDLNILPPNISHLHVYLLPNQCAKAFSPQLSCQTVTSSHLWDSFAFFSLLLHTHTVHTHTRHNLLQHKRHSHRGEAGGTAGFQTAVPKALSPHGKLIFRQKRGGFVFTDMQACAFSLGAQISVFPCAPHRRV